MISRLSIPLLLTVLVACGTVSPPPAEVHTVTVSAPPITATPAPASTAPVPSMGPSAATPPPITPLPGNGPRSRLANIVLPAGTMDLGYSDIARQEEWLAPGFYDSIVQYFRDELPIGSELDGLQWCGEGTEPSQGTTAERTVWIWGDFEDLLQVAVGRDSVVAILRRQGSGTLGCPY